MEKEWDTDRDKPYPALPRPLEHINSTLATQCRDPTPGTGVDQDQGEEAERVPVLEEMRALNKDPANGSTPHLDSFGGPC